MNIEDFLNNMDQVREAIDKASAEFRQERKTKRAREQKRERYWKAYGGAGSPPTAMVTEKWTAWVTDVYFIPEENQYREPTVEEVQQFTKWHDTLFGRKVHDDFFNPNCT